MATAQSGPHWNQIQLSHVTDGDQTSSCVTHCIPGCKWAGSWNWKQPSVEPRTPIWDANIPSAVLIMMPNAHPNNFNEIIEIIKQNQTDILKLVKFNSTLDHAEKKKWLSTVEETESLRKVYLRKLGSLKTLSPLGRPYKKC